MQTITAGITPGTTWRSASLHAAGAGEPGGVEVRADDDGARSRRG